MHTAKIFNFVKEKTHRETSLSEKLASYDTIECFKCEQPITPVDVSADGSVTYCCPGGHGKHRKFWFRFDVYGDMMYGRKGQRYYP
jgi:hypothetical protein